MTALPQPSSDPDRAGPPVPGSGSAPPGPAPSGMWPPGVPGDPWAPGSADEPRVRLSTSEDLVAAVPVLIGFHPRDSLVLVGMAGPERRGRLGLTVRVDLPSARDVRRVCAGAVAVLAGERPARAVAVVIREAVMPEVAVPGPLVPGPVVPGSAVPGHVVPEPVVPESVVPESVVPVPGPGAAAPRRDVAAAVRRELLRAGIEPLAVLWTSGTRAGDSWGCYDLPGQRCHCAGTVPDPSSTPVAVAAAVRGGRAVLPDRAAVLAQLDGDAGDRARRARLSGAVRPRAAGPGVPLLDECLAEAAEGGLGVDDARALGFCAAFADPAFITEAVRRCLGPVAPHAEQLWAVLARVLPAPGRADALALLGACALLRGDGALATLAVERALADRPEHELAGLVDVSLRGVLAGSRPGSHAGPAGLRRLLDAFADPSSADPS
ncbi:DUF4192 domain-containing protein [Pseudonocardia nematodicida]|uniref:DUF4192 domain-containing protein n=1 Tax=Pseudonocardia nematodicida TaxID=1206997 RepID=A0ABV1KJ28_9PSEU